jgi:hypothetical protein
MPKFSTKEVKRRVKKKQKPNKKKKQPATW